MFTEVDYYTNTNFMKFYLVIIFKIMFYFFCHTENCILFWIQRVQSVYYVLNVLNLYLNSTDVLNLYLIVLNFNRLYLIFMLALWFCYGVYWNSVTISRIILEDSIRKNFGLASLAILRYPSFRTLHIALKPEETEKFGGVRGPMYLICT